MDALFYGFVVFLFAAVILAVEGVYLWWMGTHGAAARRIARRLQLGDGTAGDPVDLERALDALRIGGLDPGGGCGIELCELRVQRRPALLGGLFLDFGAQPRIGRRQVGKA